MLVTLSSPPTSVSNIDVAKSIVDTFIYLGTHTAEYLDFQGDNMLIFQSFRLGDSYHSKILKIYRILIMFLVNIEVSVEVCSDSVQCFRKFMSTTEEKATHNLPFLPVV